MIKTVTISNVTHSDPDLLHASVVMLMEDAERGNLKRAQFLCRIRQSSDAPNDDLMLLLAREALRQARRLPDCAGLVENEAFLIKNIKVAA
ncbi:hypothetical protein O2N63_01140 [Aliiroseovarius sp. KMU-50]|uniref:Uncharacterized protein n=1 Tax=Aliiroseovarius salicola TaxID=3009082 RepID=A0ABT4VWY0_9RHOB|nr:hypothetical protein [Aliiroseovarius sp. KMU-50]MDA5092689.1 hypothetical protein [Aliiroseovarius sp. KMU-50]